MRVSPGTASIGKEMPYFLWIADIIEPKPGTASGTFAIHQERGPDGESSAEKCRDLDMGVKESKESMERELIWWHDLQPSI